MKKAILVLSSLFISCIIFAQSEVKKAEPVVGVEETKKEQKETTETTETILCCIKYLYITYK